MESEIVFIAIQYGFVVLVYLEPNPTIYFVFSNAKLPTASAARDIVFAAQACFLVYKKCSRLNCHLLSSPNTPHQFSQVSSLYQLTPSTHPCNRRPPPLPNFPNNPRRLSPDHAIWWYYHQ